MIITHESNYGREYRVRLVLTSDDIEGIAKRMGASAEGMDGTVLARFLRVALTEVLSNAGQSNGLSGRAPA